MPPELLEGRPNSIKADIYALGVLSYELLCGRTPFLATDNYEQLIARIHGKSFRAPSTAVRVSPVLESWILRCIDPDPEKRPADMSEVLATLSSLAGSQEALANEVGDQGAPAPEAHSEDAITLLPDPESSAPPTLSTETGAVAPPVSVVGGAPPRLGARRKPARFRSRRANLQLNRSCRRQTRRV